MSQNETIILGKIVSVQSCWVDKGGSIHANIGINRDNVVTSYRRFIFYDSRIAGMDISKPIAFDEIPNLEFRNFVQNNIGDILTLVINLLEPGELKRLFGQWEQLGLQIAT